MIQGKKGMTTYQLVDNYQIDGKEKKVEFEFADVGEITALHLKAFYGKSEPKVILIEKVAMTVEPPEGEPSEYEFLNNKKLKISKSIPAIAMNIDGGDQSPPKVKKFPEIPPGQ